MIPVNPAYLRNLSDRELVASYRGKEMDLNAAESQLLLDELMHRLEVSTKDWQSPCAQLRRVQGEETDAR